MNHLKKTSIPYFNFIPYCTIPITSVFYAKNQAPKPLEVGLEYKLTHKENTESNV